MQLTKVTRSAPTAEIMAVLERDGGVIVEDMIAPATVQAMREAVEAQAQVTAPGSKSDSPLWQIFHGSNTKRFTALGNTSPAFFDIVENDVFNAVAEAALLPSCGGYWVNTGQTMLIGPGEPAQFLHRDCGNWGEFFKPMWPHSPEITVSAMIALGDYDEEVGATRVIPGSHLWEDLAREGRPEETVPAEMSPGSALVYSGKVIHGGGANRTKDRWRLGMHLSFVVGWLTPEEANPLEYDEATVAKMSPKVRQLLGFASYDPGQHPSGRLWLKDFDAWETTA